MYHPFALQRRITLGAGAAFFFLVCPYRLLADGEALPAHKFFCFVLALLSAGLLGLMLYKALIKYFPPDEYSKFGWWLAILCFCHLVFVGVNPGGWICIAVSALAEVLMLLSWLKHRRRGDL